MPKDLIVMTQPETGPDVALRHDDGGGAVWHAASGTYQGRPASVVSIPDGTVDGHGAQLLITMDGYGPPVDVRGVLWLSHRSDGYAEFVPDDYRLSKSRPFDPFRLPRLVRRGAFFALETGERFTAIEASSYNLFARWRQDGPDAVEPVLAQLADCGFNMVRVWTHMQLAQYGIGNLIPTDEDYHAIPAFCGHLALHGLYAEFTAYTSDPGRQDPTHWPKLGAAVQGASNRLLELVNENDQGVNAVDASAFQPIPNVLCSHGSNGSGSWPVDPPWQYETYHTNLEYEFQRKVGHNAMEIADARGSACLSNENKRYPDNDSSPTHAYDAAAGAALLCAGSCFHFVSGKKSALMAPGAELACARAWVSGARSVPLEFQDGRYIRHDDLGAGIIRKYERQLSDGRGHIVEIRA